MVRVTALRDANVLCPTGLRALLVRLADLYLSDHAFLAKADALSRNRCVRTQYAPNTLPNLNALVFAQDGDEASDRRAGPTWNSVVSRVNVPFE